MVLSKRKGYRTERKIKKIFESNGWKVVRAGASLGEADLVCMKRAKCILIQVKSSKKKTFYYYEYKNKKLEGFPFYLVVDFGYGKIRISEPRIKISVNDGEDLRKFLRKFKA